MIVWGVMLLVKGIKLSIMFEKWSGLISWFKLFG